jgi:hypothetical protein
MDIGDDDRFSHIYRTELNQIFTASNRYGLIFDPLGVDMTELRSSRFVKIPCAVTLSVSTSLFARVIQHCCLEIMSFQSFILLDVSETFTIASMEKP